MQLFSIEASVLSIPFKLAFKHASAERSETQALWVQCRTVSGQIGSGEGCPREYVTGESLASAQAFVNQYRDEWLQINNLPDLRHWVDGHRAEIDTNPAAWTAVELSLLDALGKTNGQSVECLLGLPELTGEFSYTAVLGDAAPEAFSAQLQHYLRAGFSSFKIKLSGDLQRDRAKVVALQAVGIKPTQVRADANNLWSGAAEVIQHVQALDFPFMALEEPLKAGDHQALQRVAESLGCRIILDESLLRSDQLSVYAAHPRHWIANLRISKMGGVLRSLALASALRQAGLGLIIGAHVGETSVLTRAALIVAGNARDILIAQEGAFGTHLLAKDVADPSLMFGMGGVLSFFASSGAGLGLAITGTP